MKKIFAFIVCCVVLVLMVCALIGCGVDEPVDVIDAIIDITHTVTFNANGGTYVGVIEAKTINQPPVTFRDGYDFGGWYTDYALTSKAIFPMDIKSDIILYAKWIKKTYNVTFYTNGGTSVSTRNVSEINIAPSTSRSGYLFDGWYLDSNLTKKASFPMNVKNPMSLYAKWILLEKTAKCTNTRIKYMDSSESSSSIYYITPSDFDLRTLAENKYRMKITVTYDVFYRKDYDVFLDIGYMGSPKYEVAIYNSDKLGVYKNDLGTSKSSDTRTLTYTEYPANLIGEKIMLEFSTDNVQNKIYFENIVVKYECIK